MVRVSRTCGALPRAMVAAASRRADEASSGRRSAREIVSERMSTSFRTDIGAVHAAAGIPYSTAGKRSNPSNSVANCVFILKNVIASLALPSQGV